MWLCVKTKGIVLCITFFTANTVSRRLFHTRVNRAASFIFLKTALQQSVVGYSIVYFPTDEYLGCFYFFLFFLSLSLSLFFFFYYHESCKAPPGLEVKSGFQIMCQGVGAVRGKSETGDQSIVCEFSWGCHEELPPSAWLNTTGVDSLIVPEARVLETRCWQVGGLCAAPPCFLPLQQVKQCPSPAQIHVHWNLRM